MMDFRAISNCRQERKIYPVTLDTIYYSPEMIRIATLHTAPEFSVTKEIR